MSNYVLVTELYRDILLSSQMILCIDRWLIQLKIELDNHKYIGFINRFCGVCGICKYFTAPKRIG